MEGMTLLFTVCGAATLTRGVMKVILALDRYAFFLHFLRRVWYHKTKPSRRCVNREKTL